MRIGSVLLAWLADGALRYAGNAGSGIDEAASRELAAHTENLRVAAPAFEPGAIAVPPDAVFLRPQLVAAVRYTEVTESGALRQPVFEGIAEDADWRDCLAPPELQGGERASANPSTSGTEEREERRLVFSNLQKLYWPRDGITKGDLLQYYEDVWPYIQVYLRDRPLVLTRYPDGIEGKNFFQKHAPDFLPDWLQTARVDDTDFIICNEPEALLYVINLGSIPLHVWSARRDRIDNPDWLILDLDPKGAEFAAVIAVALHFRQLLRELDLPHYIKTSGQAGLHVLLPLARRLDHTQAKMLAEVLARVAAAELPEICTVARPLRDRGNKVYIDYLQNGRGKTIAAPLCVRPVPGAPVSMPLRWDQVTAELDPKDFTIKTALAALRETSDPLAPILTDELDRRLLVEAVGRLQARLAKSARQ